jgi:hypothetical protein
VPPPRTRTAAPRGGAAPRRPTSPPPNWRPRTPATPMGSASR